MSRRVVQKVSSRRTDAGNVWLLLAPMLKS